MLENDHFLIVTDLKQFTHCQRVLFYERCLPHIRPLTYKMEAGRAAHEDEEERASRRSLRQYDEQAGERVFNLVLSSPQLQLRGELDEVVYTSAGEVIPVDYKLTRSVGKHHRLQLAAYGLLLEEHHQVTVSHGFVYLIPLRKSVKVPLTPALKAEVLATLEAIWHMITHESMPAPAPSPNYCVACEFRRFCNDV